MSDTNSSDIGQLTDDIFCVNNPDNTIEELYEQVFQELTSDMSIENKEKLLELRDKLQSDGSDEDKKKYYTLLDDSIYTKYLEERADKNIMTQDRKTHWEKLDKLYEEAKKKAPLDFYLAQKKGEEIMSIDYNADPIKFAEWRELNDFGKEVWKNVQFLALRYTDLSEHDRECLKVFLKLDNFTQVEEKINQQLQEMGEI
jgi:hypothetical protein